MAHKLNENADPEHARAAERNRNGEDGTGMPEGNGSIRGAREGERDVINRPGGKDDDKEAESKVTAS